MNQVTGSVVKGLVAGAAVGAAAYMMTTAKQKHAGRRLKKKAGKAFRAMGTMANQVAGMMK